MVGTKGHGVHPIVNKQLQKWAKYTGKSINYVMKGQNYRTEMHSCFRADVYDDDDLTTALNEEFLSKLQLADKVSTFNCFVLICFLCFQCFYRLYQ